jgi:HEPN superfamily AbiU2-like protein
MPTQLEKLKAHSNHLLDCFLGLRQTYAFLEPMIFNANLFRVHGFGKRNRGFIVVRERLFFDCVQDIANLSLDTDDRAPSLKNLIEGIRTEDTQRDLRESYTVWHLPKTAEEKNDPALLDALERMELREEDQRRKQFDQHYAEVFSLWESLSSAPAMRAFKTMRDKIVAHSELPFDGTTYKPVDIESLGIKWKDLPETIGTMQRIVVLLGYIIRSADFAWAHFDEMLSRDVNAYWGLD